MMHNLMLMFASALPEETIIEKLEEAIKEHKILSNPETRNKVGMYCSLFCSKELVEKEGLEKSMKEASEVLSVHQRMKSANEHS